MELDDMSDLDSVDDTTVCSECVLELKANGTDVQGGIVPSHANSPSLRSSASGEGDLRSRTPTQLTNKAVIEWLQ